MGRPAGVIFIDFMEVAETLQCVHCQKHWKVEKGSGKHRGYCMNCGGPHCGSPGCWECVPFAKKLDEYERGIRKVL